MMIDEHSGKETKYKGEEYVHYSQKEFEEQKYTVFV